MRFLKFSVVSIVLIALSGCSNNEGNSASIMRACEAFNQYRNTFDIPTRIQLLNQSAFQFRKEAYSSNEAKFEVLAEYASMETDRLGNISPEALGEINEFCKKSIDLN